MLRRIFVFLLATLMSASVFVFSIEADTQIQLVFDGTPMQFDAPPIMQNGRVLVPLRPIAEALDIQTMWLPEERSVFYFNNSGVGYNLYIDNPDVQVGHGAGIDPTYVTIDAPPTIINGRTYVPVRFIAESFGIAVSWDKDTKSVIINTGKTPKNANSVQIEEDGKTYTVSAIPGTGARKDWRQLKGYPSENIVSVYFQYNDIDSRNINYEKEYIGKYNFDKTVEWSDILGLKHSTTIDELFNIQSDISDYARKQMQQMYGAQYDEWNRVQSTPFYTYIEKYLIATGERESDEVATKDPYSYIHDKKLVQSLNTCKAAVNYNDTAYTVYSIPADNNWRQLKGYYLEDYFDLYFYPTQESGGTRYDSVGVKVVPKEKYNVNKDITWIGLDHKPCTSKLDIYNAIDYFLHHINPQVLEYYTDDSTTSKPLDIPSPEDKALHDVYMYCFNKNYNYFIEQYLTQAGASLNLPQPEEVHAEIENFISRKISENECKMLINNHVMMTIDSLSQILDGSGNVLDLNDLIGKKVSESHDISNLMQVKGKDKDLYKFKLEYISEDTLRDDYKVSFSFIPEVDDNMPQKAQLRSVLTDEVYQLGLIPQKPLPTQAFDANGIHILFKDGDAYLSIKDLKAKGILQNDIYPDKGM